MTVATPTRQSGAFGRTLAVGDRVVLPEGQLGVLRYIGKVQGKSGEFAGVELVDGYESQGRHSGTYDGVTYFKTSRPGSGLFITYSKVIASTYRSSPLGDSSRPSSRTMTSANAGTGPVAGTPAQRRLSRHNLGMATPAPRSSMAANVLPRPSLTTPRRPKLSTVTARGGPLSPEISTPRLSTVRKRLDQALPIPGSISKDLAQARAELEEKNAQLEQQGQLLTDLESSLQVLQDRLQNGDDQDAKVAAMKAEFEQKRAEFRQTIDNLEFQSQQSVAMYEQEIRNLKETMGDARLVGDRMEDLEREIATLETVLRNSQVSEQNAQVQLSRLADVENKMLEKDQELEDAARQISRYKEMLQGTGDGGQLQKDFEALQLTNKRLEMELLSAGERHQEMETLRKENASLIEEKETLAKEIKAVQAAEGADEALDKMQKENATLTRENQSLDERCQVLAKQTETLEHDNQRLTKENKSIRQTLDSLQAEHEHLKQEYKLVDVERNELLDMCTQLEQANKDLETMMETRAGPLESMTKPRSMSSSTDNTPDTPEAQPELQKIPEPVVQLSKDPAAGRKLWCAMCERDGHESLDCPYEEEF